MPGLCPVLELCNGTRLATVLTANAHFTCQGSALPLGNALGVHMWLLRDCFFGYIPEFEGCVEGGFRCWSPMLISKFSDCTQDCQILFSLALSWLVESLWRSVFLVASLVARRQAQCGVEFLIEVCGLQVSWEISAVAES